MSNEDNSDEANVGNLPIPDPLKREDGTQATTVADWTQKRRPEVLRLFEHEVYGKTPEVKPDALRFVILSEDKQALGGMATMREVAIYFTAKESPHAEILLYLPNKHAQSAPVFVGLNFGGNHTVSNDPRIRLSQGWFNNDEKAGSPVCWVGGMAAV